MDLTEQEIDQMLANAAPPLTQEQFTASIQEEVRRIKQSDKEFMENFEAILSSMFRRLQSAFGGWPGEHISTEQVQEAASEEKNDFHCREHEGKKVIGIPGLFWVGEDYYDKLMK